MSARDMAFFIEKKVLLEKNIRSCPVYHMDLDIRPGPHKLCYHLVSLFPPQLGVCLLTFQVGVNPSSGLNIKLGWPCWLSRLISKCNHLDLEWPCWLTAHWEEFSKCHSTRVRREFGKCQTGWWKGRCGVQVTAWGGQHYWHKCSISKLLQIQLLNVWMAFVEQNRMKAGRTNMFDVIQVWLPKLMLQCCI